MRAPTVFALTLFACGPTAPTIEEHADAGGGGGRADARPVADPDDPDDLEGCSEMLALEPSLPPELLIVLDRSGSMEEIWSATTTAIKQVVLTLDAHPWGLAYFPTSSVESGDGCKVDPVAVPVAPSNYGAIASSIDATGPFGLTPTRQALEQGGAYLSTRATPNPKYIVLLTDGIPNCAVEPNCDCPPGFTRNSASQCVMIGGGPYDYYSCDVVGDLGINGTYWAMAGLRAAGIRTFVFGLASGGFNDFGLNVLAPAGGEARPGATRYYPATTPAELESTIASLAAGLVSCSFELPETIPGQSLIGIEIDGEPVPQDPARIEGWDYDSTGTSIRLYGAWCERLQAGPADVTAFYVCPPVE